MMKTNRIFWGLAIMLFGSVLLVNSLGLVHINVWKFIGPGFLILLGLWFIYNAILHPRTETAENLSIPSQAEEELSLNISHGAGHLHLSAAQQTGNLLSGTFINGIDSKIKRSGKTAEITLKPFGDPVDIIIPGNFQGINWDMLVTADIPVQIKLNTGASESMLDLSQINIKALDLSTGASKTEIRFSEKADFCSAKINAGVAAISMQIPAQIAASILIHGKEMSSIHVDTNRFIQIGDRYESSDYATAAKKLEIEIKPGLGEIKIQ
jgi:hypothetical protein